MSNGAVFVRIANRAGQHGDPIGCGYHLKRCEHPVHFQRLRDLDVMSVEQCIEAVSITAGLVALEASGGITINNAKAYAATGVNYLAIGALTHSAPALDIGLDFKRGK